MRYHFRVTYTDATTFIQSRDDVSLTDPKRSSYFDVDQSRVRRFEVGNFERSLAVDLSTGFFSKDHGPFQARGVAPTIVGARRLVYFRRHIHTRNLTTDTHEIQFHLGWEGTRTNGAIFRNVVEIGNG